MLSKKTEEPWPMPCSWPEKDGKVSSSAAWSPSLPKLVRQYDEGEEEYDYGHTCDDVIHGDSDDCGWSRPFPKLVLK